MNPDPQFVRTLRDKAEALKGIIGKYEKTLDEVRRDLAHVEATIRLFEMGDRTPRFPIHLDSVKLFRAREIGNLCKQALAEQGPMDTRELALYVIRSKGMDEADKVLRQAIAFRIVQSLTLLWKRGKMGSDGKRNGVRVWRV